MEIHIQLAGVELGPYSEKQVLDYLQESLLSPTDPARFHGTEKWQTVQEILDSKSKEVPAPVTVEAPKMPESIPVTLQSPLATGTMPLPPKTIPRKTASITTSLLPVPKPMSKDTIRVPIPQLNKSAAQQTTLVKKAIPMVPQPPPPKTESAAKSSEKARTSLLTAVNILAKKKDPEAGTPPAAPAAPPLAPSTPSTQPIAFPKSTETRTMPMSVVRAIAKKSDLDEKSGAPVEISLTKRLSKSTEPIPLPSLPDPKKPSLSFAPKSLLKKTEPENKTEPQKVVERPAQPAPPTAPDDSIASAKLPQTVRTAPMAPVRALPKKATSEAKAAPEIAPAKPASSPADKSKETSPAEAVRFVPDSAPLPPGTVAKASSVSPVLSSKLLKRTTGSLPSLVKSLEKKPLESVPHSADKEKEIEIKPPSTAELPGEPPAPVEEETGEPKPSFFQSFAAKLGTLFKSKTPAEQATEIETKPEVMETPEKKPEIEEQAIEAKETTIIKEKKELKDKLVAKEKTEVVKAPELKKSAIVEEPKPFLGLKTLPPAPDGDDDDDKKALSMKDDDDDEAFEKEKPVAGKSKGVPRPVIFAGIGLIVAAGLSFVAYLYVQSSHQAAASLLLALKNGDQAQLQQLVDFPSIRKALTAQVAAQSAQSSAQDADSRTAIQDMIKNSINYYVTPEAISALATKGNLPPAGPDSTVTPALAADIFSKLIALPVKSEGMVAYNRYVIDLDAAKLEMDYAGSSWKLSQIGLNTDFKLPETPGSHVAPADLGKSLTQPVLETYFEDGKAKFDKQDWDGAITDYNQVLAMNPESGTAYIAYSNRGMALFAKGESLSKKGDAPAAKSDMDAAIADFTQAIALNPTLAEAFFNRGVAKSTQNDIDGALADYNQAITLDPKMAAAFYKRGTIRTTKGDYEGASADFTQDIALDPNSAGAYSNRGFIKLAQHDLDGAIKDFDQALAIDPKIAGVYFNRGSAKYAKADLDGAIADFNSALDLDPKMVRGYYSRGIAKNAKNDLDGALADYNQALSLDPNLAPALEDRALIHRVKGELKEALDDYNRALTLDPKMGSAYYQRGLIKEQLNDLDGAIADSSRALDIDPKQTQAYYNRGFAKLVKGNLEGARNDLQKFCELASKDPYADHSRLYLWLIEKAQSPTSSANQDLSDALQNNWSAPPDDLVTKIALFLLDRESEADLIAAATSSDAQKDAGRHCEVWYFAGMKRLLAGDKTTAIDYFQKCLATGQKNYCEYILAQAELKILVPNT